MNTDTTTDFAATVRSFCAWCEGPRADVTDAKAAYWLARLYAEALQLPVVGYENDWGLPDLPADGLARAKANLASFWGRYYREFFDPSPELLEEEPVVGDLGDDLTDVYMDLRAGLVLHDAGRPRDALWHWSYMQRIHWGQHATAALHALHCLSISRSD